MTTVTAAATGGDPGVIRCESAEAVVLGAAMLAGHRAGDILADLAEDDFADGKHQAVFCAIRRLLDDATPVDPVTVLGELSRSGDLPPRTNGHVGVFLIDLIQLVPAVANAGYYRRIVLEHAWRRRAAQAGERIARHAADAPAHELTDLITAEYAALAAAARRAGIPTDRHGMDRPAEPATQKRTPHDLAGEPGS